MGAVYLFLSTTPVFAFIENNLESEFVLSQRKAHPATKTKIGVTSESFISPDPQSDVNRNQVIDAAFDGHWDVKNTESGLSARVAVGMNKPSLYQFYGVPEAYRTYRLTTDSTFTFGRKKESWSVADETWQLGMWQPRLRWNYLLPEQQGLTGLFYDKDFGDVGFEAFGSYLCLPDQGSKYNINDGKFESASQYFKFPASSTALFGQNTPVKYSVDMPSYTKLLFQPQVAAKLRLGPQEGFHSNLAYAYKPMNQIMMAVDGYLDLNSYNAMVTVHPRILYHHLGTLEGIYSMRELKVWGSITREWPIADSTPPVWTTQQTATSTIAAIGSEFQSFRWSSQATRMGLSYMKRVGGDADDRGPFATQGASLFASRYPFKEAAMWNLWLPMPGSLGNRLSWNSKFMYEMNNQSSAVIGMFQYQIDRSWQATLGGEILSAKNDVPTSGNNSDMISQNRGNDRVYGGVRYAF